MWFHMSHVVSCRVVSCAVMCCAQGLLIPADSVQTPFSYRTCQVSSKLLSGETYCSEYSTFDVKSAALIPPFTYNNQCGSAVILASYIPVFLLGYSIQLLLPLCVLMSLTYLPYESISPCVRHMLHGLLWPEYWLRQESHVRTLNQNLVHNDPTVLLKIRTIFCNDVFNNWLLVLTFGLCSPVLAVAIVCSVVLNMSLWVLLIGRFTSHLAGDLVATAATTTATAISVGDENSCHYPCTLPKTVTVASASASKRSQVEHVIHFALVALAAVHIPLLEVLAGSFWRLGWCSACFVPC